VTQNLGEKQAVSEPRAIPDRSREEVLALLEHRRKHPLYIDSDYFEGMSLSYVNPEYLQDAPPTEAQPAAAPITPPEDDTDERLASAR